MKKVLLILPPDVNCIEPFLSSPRKQMPMGVGFPLGLGYIAAVLIETGKYEVRIYDAILHKASIADTLRVVAEFKPDYVGMTMFTVNAKCAVAVAQGIKNGCARDIPVIVGGPHASTDYPNLLQNYPCFDYIVVGEAENTIVELLAQLDDGYMCPEVKGVMFRGGKFVHREPTDINAIPFPARSLVNIDDYIVKQSAGLPYQTELMSARGCTHHCAFCSFQKQWRGRMPFDVIVEMETILRMSKRVRSFVFMDDDFSPNKKRVLRLCTMFREFGMSKYPWVCNCRVDQVDEEMLVAMKRGGCAKVFYGLETANESIISNLGKRITMDNVRRTLTLTRKIGINSIISIIAGNPGETHDTLRETYDFVKSLPCEAVNFGVMSVFPGTKLAALQAPEDFVAYVYKPEILNPHTAMSANVPTFINPGLDREELKRVHKKMLRDLVLYKIFRHPWFALKKLWRMPRIAVTTVVWLLGLKRYTASPNVYKNVDSAC